MDGKDSTLEAFVSTDSHTLLDQSLFSAISFNRSDLQKQSSGRISKKKFINAINYVHFAGGHIYAHVNQRKGGQDFLLRVYPEPCQGSDITCNYQEGSVFDSQGFSFRNLIIDDGRSILCMPVEVFEIEKTHFCAKISEQGFVFSERQSRRFLSLMVDARVKQGVYTAEGVLEDFSPYGFRIVLKEGDAHRFEPLKDLTIELCKEKKIIYSGKCRLVRVDGSKNSIVMSPYQDQQRVYKKRKYRNPRLNLVPTPKIVFSYPLNGKTVSYEIFDITQTGFSVSETADQSLLIPGLIIHGASLLFSGDFKLMCDIRVVYGLKQKNNAKYFGIAIIDMDMVTYNKFFDILSKASDVHANVSREINMEALWQFFFESGFIYPKKYESLSRYNEIFKKTYDSLYHDSPEVFANFTYQRNGVVFGHVSIIKAYERTWMIHHLAAKPMGRKRTGLFVLNHILNYFDGLYRMPSIGMDYMIFYFRPDNRFPDYFFGGFCRDLKNPQGCSMDQFAYYNFPLGSDCALPAGWEILEGSDKDVDELSEWYDKVSGGLMIKAFCLEKHSVESKSLEEAYSKAGLKRKYSLKKLVREGKTRAFFLIDLSDLGVNLSDLLNSIKILVVDGEEMSREVLDRAVNSIGRIYGTETVPILVYPVACADTMKINYDKKYNLWTLGSQYGDDYSEHLKAKAKFRMTKFIIHYLKTKLLRNEH